MVMMIFGICTTRSFEGECNSDISKLLHLKIFGFTSDVIIITYGYL